MTRQLIKDIAERGWRRVINLTSITVKKPVEGLILSYLFSLFNIKCIIYCRKH